MENVEVVPINSVVGLNVAKAIYNVAAEVGWVEMTGNNSYQNYTYASELDLLAAVRPLMMKHGLVSFPCSIEYLPTSDPTRVDGIVTYRFVHAETGEFIDVRVLSSGADKTDKGAFKLMTGAMKYALRQTFLVAAGDDAEAFDTSGNLTGPTNQMKHPISKVIAAGKQLGYDLETDKDFVALWKKLNVDISNLTSSTADMKFTDSLKSVLRDLRDGKDRKTVLNEFAAKQLADANN